MINSIQHYTFHTVVKVGDRLYFITEGGTPLQQRLDNSLTYCINFYKSLRLKLQFSINCGNMYLFPDGSLCFVFFSGYCSSWYIFLCIVQFVYLRFSVKILYLYIYIISLHCKYKLLCLFNYQVVSNSFVTPYTVACQAPLLCGISQARILE